MIFPRNRRVGSFSEIDFGHTRFNNPTTTPRPSQKPAESGTLGPEPERET
jgi:hypothetical protein